MNLNFDAKQHKNKILIITIVTLFIALTVILLLHNQYKSIKSEDKPVNTPPTSYTLTATENPNQFTYTGKHLKATLFEGWSIKEYVDGEKTQDFNGYFSNKGLTSIELYYEDKLLLSMEAINNIDFIGQGTLIPKFEDTEETYLQRALEEGHYWAKQQNKNSAEILDLTNEEYSEINLFGADLRRVGDKVYVNKESIDSPYFNTNIFGPSFPNFTNIAYFITYNHGTHGSYSQNYITKFLIRDLDLPEEVLHEYDQILESLTYINPITLELFEQPISSPVSYPISYP